ncbi:MULTISPECIES: flavin reductase family protein [unclassified Micromonospora]|uniref:flavin reductase family protein n=1 Tax=unclassified Micromonospora TaxID=2617518 RepID=UPI0036295824
MDVPPGSPLSAVTDSKTLRRALGAFATGVTVVTVGGVSAHGMTANSFTPVSLDPPLVSICVGRQAIMHASLEEAGTFAVSVLASDQEGVARYFADQRRPLGREQFDAVDWMAAPHTGAPLVRGALAYFECEVWRTYDGGDHTIFIGRVLSMSRAVNDEALLFLSGRFHHLRQDRTEVTT